MSKPKLIIKSIATLVMPYIFQVITMVIASMYLGIKMAADPTTAIMDQKIITEIISGKVLEMSTLLALISSLLLIAVIYLFHRSKERTSMHRSYRFNAITSKHISLVFALGVLGFSFSVSFGSIFSIQNLDPQTTDALENLVRGDSFILTLLAVGIIIPICEEIVFRGSILKNLTENMSFKWAIIIQAVLFSLYHMNLVQAMPTLVLGLITGFAVYFTNSIWSGIFIHMINNTLAVVISNIAPASLSISYSVFAVLMGIAFIGILYAVKKLSQNRAVWLPIEVEMVVDVEGEIV